MTDTPLDVIAVEWVRARIGVDVRGDVAALPTPSGFCLRRGARRSPEVLAPAREVRTDTALTLWFDIVAGPRRQPLAPGVWRLSDDQVAPPVRLRLGPDLGRHARSFRLPHARYDAVIEADPARAVLTLSIALDRSDGRLPRRWPGWRFGRRPISALERAVRRAARWAFIASARRTTRRSGGRIVFASAARSGFTGNLKVVHDRMVERGMDADHELVRIGTAAPAGALGDLRARWRATRILLGADAILVAGSRQRFVYGLGLDPDVRFIQLWHASGAFKTVGFSRIGQSDAPDAFSAVHRDYTHAIVSSQHDVPFYAEAFGIPESRVVATGIPRMDRFFDDRTRAAGRAAAAAAFPMTVGRAVWLFAPTYRGEARSATYPMDRIDFAALHALALARDAIVIFKMHPFVTQPVPIPEGLTDRLVDGTRTSLDVNDLMFAVDLLVTDYSSIVFEYSVLGRPMLFYAYDLEEYTAERDFYVPFEAFVPGRIVRSFEELLDAIRHDDYALAKVTAFVRDHFAHLDAGATDRAIDLVLAR